MPGKNCSARSNRVALREVKPPGWDIPWADIKWKIFVLISTWLRQHLTCLQNKSLHVLMPYQECFRVRETRIFSLTNLWVSIS
jgi:hypothetical protein